MTSTSSASDVFAVLHGIRAPLVALVPGAAGIALAAVAGGAGESPQVWTAPPDDAGAMIARVEDGLHPRWVWWSSAGIVAMLRSASYDLQLRSCWDLAAVHRLLAGGWADDPARVWAWLHGLDPETAPADGQLDLLGPGAEADEGSPDEPVRPDGHLRPDWAAGAWAASLTSTARWAALTLETATAQASALRAAAGPEGVASGRRGDPVLAAWAESAAAMLAAELGLDGLPIDRVAAERTLTELIGPRPASAEAEARARSDRDARVLRHVPSGIGVDSTDLRNPAQVRTLLGKVGLDLPDTRSWRLERHAGEHPLVDALLAWRKAERIATTYGYGWLDRHVGADGRLRGRWTGSDGGAGRMTAQAGLHSLPAELRGAVAAEPGHVLVRADLGQIEPRVLAAVSGDPALAAATADDDLYTPVAQRLRCERPVAKVAVLAAMYGQTSGAAGEALTAMQRTYPVAMRVLRAGEDAGRTARPVRTYGGRLIQSRAIPPPPPGASGDQAAAHRGAVAGQGRYVRNALVQGAAAELFKAWSATVRAELLGSGAGIVLCLHDELLVHAPAALADRVAALLHRSLDETAARWFPPDPPVRFVADVSVLARWSEAKP